MRSKNFGKEEFNELLQETTSECVCVGDVFYSEVFESKVVWMAFFCMGEGEKFITFSYETTLLG